MRLGLLGPLPPNATSDHAQAVEKAAGFLLKTQKVTRAIYLGPDDALERVVERWARRLVGDDPTDEAAWRRAHQLALVGSSEEIDAFVKGQRMRLRLRSLESLPHRILRTMEMVGDRIAVLIHDKAMLDEEDIYAAALLVYGKSDTALIKKIGQRWFLTPGTLGPAGGVCVLDDAGEDIVATVFDPDGNQLLSETLLLPKASKMRVQGSGPA
jgi:hypothetical protein